MKSIQYLTRRVQQHMSPTIFEETSGLAIKHKGFPDWEPPQFVKDGIIKAVNGGENQYIRVAGHQLLVEQISRFYSKQYKRQIDPLNEIIISNGATQLLTNTYLTLLEEGDEVIVFEPFFEFWIVSAKYFGAKIKFFSMTQPNSQNDQWTIDFVALEKLFSNKTKLLVINTPQNPTGQVLTHSHYTKIIQILSKFPNTFVLSDEVYEFMQFDGRTHVTLATYPEVADRVISIHSLGKTFSLTGWRMGFSIANPTLSKAFAAAQSWSTFHAHRPSQVALAHSLVEAEKPYEGHNNYYDFIQNQFITRRQEISDILKNAPFNWRVLQPEGGFFICCDIRNCIKDIPRKYFYKSLEIENGDKPINCQFEELKNPDYLPDYAFYLWLLLEYQVGCIPLNSFYDKSNTNREPGQEIYNFVRFALCKKTESVETLRQRLHK